MKHVGLCLNKIPDKSDSSHVGLAHLVSYLSKEILHHQQEDTPPH